MTVANVGNVTFEKYLCGQPQTQTSEALSAWLHTVETDRSYLPMMHYRIDGKAAGQCKDIYYIAMLDGQPVSRLWNGWGKHAGAVGNFGNFLTDDAVRGRGIGRKMLELWQEDLARQDDRPIGLFCSAANGFLIDLYAGYGFTQAVIKPGFSMLYKPLDGSPARFEELCEDYYCTAKALTARPATVQYRHEIDCLLKFSLAATGEAFGIPGCKTLEEAIVWPHIGDAQLLFTEKNRPVGWSFTPVGGQTQWQIHPKYRKLFAETFE